MTLGLVFAIVASLVLVVTPTASAGGKPNAGALKVTQDASCATEPNDPWVLTPYYFGGTGFSADVSFTVTAVPHGGNSGTEEITDSGTTDDDGAFCIGPFTTGSGQMKVTYTDPEDSKHKVYNVRNAPELEEVTPQEPTVTDPTCQAPGTLVLPDTTGVDYSVTPHYDGPGTYTVTATPDEGYAFPDKATTAWTLTVEPPSDCPAAPSPATPTAPTFQDPTCATPAGITLPADTDAIDYTQTGTPAPGATVTVTATARDGYVLDGYTGPWTHTYSTPTCPATPPAPVVDVALTTSQCSLVNGNSTVQLVVTNRGTAARPYLLTSPGAPTIEGGQLAAGAVRNHLVSTFGTWTLVVEGQAARSVTPSTAGCVAPGTEPEDTAVVAVVTDTQDEAAADSVEGDELDAEAEADEAELASTGADTRAGGYGALLLLAGILLLTARRRALRY